MTGCVGRALMGTRVAFSVQVLRDGLDYVVVVDKCTPTVLGPKHTHIHRKKFLLVRTNRRTHIGKSHAVIDEWNGIIIMSTFRKPKKKQKTLLSLCTQAHASHGCSNAYVHMPSGSDAVCMSTHIKVHQNTWKLKFWDMDQSQEKHIK